MRLDTLVNWSRPKKNGRRVGRGPGSGVGKTCGRGEKGAGSRSGYKRRYGNEGGNLRMFKRMPTKGFSNARFQKPLDAINLKHIEALFADGEKVDIATLRQHGLISGKSHGVKILGGGNLTKKVTFEVKALSKSAKEKLESVGIKYTIC